MVERKEGFGRKWGINWFFLIDINGEGTVMKPDGALERESKILGTLSRLPQKILSLHGREDVTEFVLRDLCHEHCFNLKKAAFFVDNPDFNCLKGVAGYYHEDTPTVCDFLWDHPEQFMKRMQESSFNKKVRSLWIPSLNNVEGSKTEFVSTVAQTLEMNSPRTCSLPVKYGNHALLVFEKENEGDGVVDEHVCHGLSLLGFCPIY
ncbi:hypothetical protein KAH94_05135 [bacterium]|nr:hypothetical protein [bacterium]